MMLDYAAIFAFALVACAFAAVSLIASQLLRPSVPDDVKLTTYECGMEATGTTEVKTNVRFYVFALLFVVFDVETLFVYPWAVSARAVGPVALLEMLIFLVVLFIGLVYAWRKGALAWE
ncbi:MAG TPA: NADH-quinone oxidoreductase subunit A [Elusimicrobiota bacterium]|jgi:NADH-quinone oxidoreductase subunit A|nr:NADH-quinone oxidoreductase subunit A [Elusimicrobiota bacterium]